MKKSFGTVVRADARHSDHVTKALNELASQSDRSAAMVATTILSLVLTEALKSYLHSDTRIAAHFFAADGPIMPQKKEKQSENLPGASTFLMLKLAFAESPIAPGGRGTTRQKLPSTMRCST
jgi:hypothetical protein